LPIGKPTIIEISDGLDGNTIDVKTVQFGFENVSYEIDLGHQTFGHLAQAIAPYVPVARKSGGRRRWGWS
jgi:hypothetical protein